MIGRIAYAHSSIWKDMAGSQRRMAYFGDFEFGIQGTRASHKKHLEKNI